MIGFGSSPSRQARAVVTGAGSGIGQAFAVELAARGGQVVCADLDPARAQRTVDVITDDGGKALAVRCDVAVGEQVAELARQAGAWFGNLPSLVVNNAGIGAGGSTVEDTPLAEWQRVIDINLWGVVHGCRVFTPLLREAGEGGVINVASAAGFASAPSMGAYNVSKAGVVALSETLAAELAGSGVRVSVLCPTFVRTDILNAGHITQGSAALGESLMRWTGVPPRRIARGCLDAHDRGQLYVVPQLDAKAVWAAKRLAPGIYNRAAGLLGRLGPDR
jgi:NAD(P)-dependent dehydrogenase (short-subunit alcohol dehydrogenase family)